MTGAGIAVTVRIVATGSALGGYLRGRRERLRPEDVGLPTTSRRRVAGLRREEVALLAGISAEYYLRLEQGRDLHPSDQVLDALARALCLTGDEEVYLHELARPARPPRRRSRPVRVSPAVRSLIDQWSTPAVVQGPHLETLAANPMAVALCPFFAPGTNSLRAAFLEPEMREFYRDWDAMTAKAVAYLRSLIGGQALDDPVLVALVGELSLHSERFRTLWAQGDVRRKTSGLTLVRHPLVGELDLHYEKFLMPGPQPQVVVTYHADPGTESYERLQLLAHLTDVNASPATATAGRA